MIKIEMIGLEPIKKRFGQFPDKYNKIIQAALKNSLLDLHSHTPAYPPQPETSTYVRTGTLGKSLGIDYDTGREIGSPDIFEIKMGGSYDAASFGTRLNYAPDVIGDTEQIEPFVRYWWTIRDIAEAALGDIVNHFQMAVNEMAKFLDGKGL